MKTVMTRYIIYLTPDIQKAFEAYKTEEFGLGARVSTAVIRKAIAEFLERKGYNGSKNGQTDS